MTRASARKFPKPAWFLLLIAALLAAGCDGEVDVFPEPGGADEKQQVFREEDRGCVMVSFASFPLRPNAPPDGVRTAVSRAAALAPCSAAAFFWTERDTAERWIGVQMNRRRSLGLPVRLIVVGHGLGGAEACDTVRELLTRAPDAEIVLLLTVDAVKTGRIGSAAGVTGAALNRLPGVNTSLAAYYDAPSPDGLRFFSHINYYQDKSQLYHGAAMPGAENHLLEDWTGLLNHGNADDFAMPLIYTDLRAALQRWTP